MKRLTTLILGASILGLAACGPVNSVAPGPPRVVLWGDSFGEIVAPHLPANYEVQAFGGTAPCDWLSDIVGLAASLPPAVAVLLFVGNTATPCTGGTIDGYGLDVAQATNALESAGSDVVVVAAPPVRDGPSPNPLNAVYESNGADLLWGPSESVAPGGTYNQTYRDADGGHLNPAGALRFADAIAKGVASRWTPNT